ncbi:MAG: YfiR family protein [Psychrobium sp.]|nr:YfiR family protein [Psychrobium sp.]
MIFITNNPMQLFFLFCILCCIASNSYGASSRDREYQIKSKLISYFIQFSRWKNIPAQHFNFCTTNERVNTIVELGLDKKRWHNLSSKFIIVKPHEEEFCQVLFIDRDNTELWQEHLLKNKLINTLIIGEKQGFARNIGHINFFLADNKLRFEVNNERLKSSNITLSSKVLRLARLVNSTQEQP